VAWTRQFGTDGTDHAAAVSIDGLGAVIVAGTTEGLLGAQQSGSWDAFIRKYRPNGTVAWTRQFGTAEANRTTGIEGAAVDRNGNVYVVGNTTGTLAGQNTITPGDRDAFISKFGKGGGHKWTRQFGTPEEDAAYAVAVDGAGDIIVVGITRGHLAGSAPAPDQYDVFVRKYRPNGNVAWTRQLGTDQNDHVGGVAVVPGGREIYVTGHWFPPGGSNGQQVFLRRYAPGGKVRWKKQFGTSMDDYSAGVGVDCKGRPYVGGHTDGAFTGFVNTGGGVDSYDVFVRAFRPDGRVRWTRQVGGSGPDAARSVAVSCSGKVVVTGTTEDDTAPLPGRTSKGDYDAYVMAWSAAGKRLLIRQFGTPQSDEGYGAAIDSQGRRFAVAGTTLGAFGKHVNPGGWDAFLRLFRDP
jgi:hypothetical protein